MIIQDPTQVLESGEETLFPALHVGTERTSGVVSLLFLCLFCSICVFRTSDVVFFYFFF